MTDPDVLRERLVDALTASAVLPTAWRPAFDAVARHTFIPDLVWRQDKELSGAADLAPLLRADDPDEWLRLVYSDAAITTQVDDGLPVGPGLLGRRSTSSSSMPTVMASMLDALHAEPGMTVLEIGTGTGYNAALLAHRLGAVNVATVEIDPEVADGARAALSAAGMADLEVVTGDGSIGHPARAPYDRVISTAAAPRVPYSWVAQTRPGGMIVTPWESDYYYCGLLALTVSANGSAAGHLVGKASFMCLRDQRVRPVLIDDLTHHAGADQAESRETGLHPYDVAGDHDAATAIGIQVRQCRFRYRIGGDGEAVLWLLDQWSGSWASLHHHPDAHDGPYRVRQSGSRRLFDEVETAHRRWCSAGRPGAETWRFTVDAADQRVEHPLIQAERPLGSAREGSEASTSER